jgi:ABC-type multidrug transport system permease subunit
VLAAIESIVAIVLTVPSTSALSFFLVLILVFNMRSRFSATMTPALIFFCVFYFTINFCTNVIDWAYKNLLRELEIRKYYHDDDMSKSFSYKLHMTLLCAIAAFVCGQILMPTVGVIKQVPEMLSELFNFTLPLCVSMFLTFLYELTSYDPLKRTKLFREELTKCFMACLVFQAMLLITMSWFFSLGRAIQLEVERKEANILH